MVAKVQITAEQFALRAGLIGGAVSSFVAWLIFNFYGPARVSIRGGLSITEVGFYMAVLACFVAYLYGFRQQVTAQVAADTRKATGKFVAWRDNLSLAFAYSVAVGGVLLIASRLFDQSFQGLTLDHFSSALIVGGVVGAVLYFITNAARNASSTAIIKLFAAVLVGGVMFSMFTNANVDWWRENFSTLGMSVSSANTAFNFTLVISALVMLALTTQVFSSLDAMIAHDKSLEKQLKSNIVKGFFVFIAIAFGCVGIFHYVPNSIMATLHNTSAFSLVIAFVSLIVLLRWLAPGFSKEFMTISYIIAGGLVGGYILFTQIGYLSLTAFELLAFVLCFSWLILFLKNVDLLAAQASTKKK